MQRPSSTSCCRRAQHDNPQGHSKNDTVPFPAGTPSLESLRSKIVFLSDRDGYAQLYVMNADGSGKTNLSNNTYNDWDPIWVK